MNLRPLAPHANALAKLRYTQIVGGGDPLELKIRLLKLFDAVPSAFLDDLLERIPRMEVEGGDVDGNGGGKDDSVAEPFHFEIGENRLFLAGYVGKSNEVVLGQVFQVLLLWKCG